MSLMLTRGRDAVLVSAFLCDLCGAESPHTLTTWDETRARAFAAGWTEPVHRRRHVCPQCAALDAWDAQVEP